MAVIENIFSIRFRNVLKPREPQCVLQRSLAIPMDELS